MPLRAREADDLGDQQEVIGEAHVRDHCQLLVEPRPRAASRDTARSDVTPRQAGARQLAQALLAAHAGRERSAREDRRSHLELEPAARRQRDVVRQGLGRRLGSPGTRAHRAHAPRPFGGHGEPRLARRERVRCHALDQLAVRCGDRHAMRVVVAWIEHHHVAGRDQREPERTRGVHARGERSHFGAQAAHAHPQSGRRAARSAGQRSGLRLGRREPGGQQRGGQPGRLDHHVQPAALLAERDRQVEMRIEMAAREQRAQARVAAAVGGQHQRAPGGVRDLGAGDRLQALGAGRLHEAHREIEVVAIGERQRAQAARERAFDQRLGRSQRPRAASRASARAAGRTPARERARCYHAPSRSAQTTHYRPDPS